jgi:cytosine/adenosine deaminase-related metal-dependent hydrolase
VAITVIRSGTVITGDGRTCLPDTDLVLVDGVVRDLPRSDPSRSFGQADLIIDATGQIATPGPICDSPSSTRPLTRWSPIRR